MQEITLKDYILAAIAAALLAVAIGVDNSEGVTPSEARQLR
jgi:hypothetical protein